MNRPKHLWLVVFAILATTQIIGGCAFLQQTLKIKGQLTSPAQ